MSTSSEINLQRRLEMVWIDLVAPGMEPINQAINDHYARLTLHSPIGIHPPSVLTMCHHSEQDVLLVLFECWYLA